MTRVIELNDAALRLADAEAILARSPGYAVVDARRLLVGESARQQARLDPRHTTNQFWHRLSTDPVPHPHPSARSLADLAHAHLLELWAEPRGDADEEVIFTLPGTLEREQIALLLGIARECPFRAVGLVDASVAATAGRQPDVPAVTHVDALLHEAVVTTLTGDGAWQRTRVVDVPNLGLASLREAWINVIADTFVRETRFDPLHDASTEQTLFDRLDEWIDALAGRAEIDLELQTSSQFHRVSMSRQRLVDKAAPRFALLADAVAEALPVEGSVLVSAALGRLPGLLEAFADRLGDRTEVLAEDAVVRGAMAHESGIRHDGEALRFVTRLPRTSTARPEPVADAPPPPSPTRAAPPEHAAATDADPDRPTHVLLDHRAWPLAGPRLTLGGPDGIAAERYPARLAVLEQREDGWHLLPVDGGPAMPPLRPGEARVLGPERALVSLIKVEVG
jgi:hypothetical protein